tara:strand:- start:763 stop:1050 length:288 start_codon:yes stop_codon:yes gene_type:complete
MAVSNIISQLSSLSESQLLKVNNAILDQLKAVRNRKAATARHMFSAGDLVGFGDRSATGKQSYKEGELIRVMRSRAKVLVGNTTWTVPLNMLSAA